MTSNPHISVIVPSYNHRNYLPERMGSILNQTRQDFELILLDDASQDGSGDFLESYADRPGVKVIRNEQNSGCPFVQWNRGVQEAKGDLIWIAESDDVADPQFLEVLAGILDSHATVGLAFCRSNRIDQHGARFSDGAPTNTDEVWCHDFQSVRQTVVREHLYLSNTIVSASAVVFRREIYNQAGPADATLSLSGDWLQWCRMLLVSDMYFVAQPLSGTRIHTNTRRHSTATSGTLELESLAVQKRIRALLKIDRTRIRQGADCFATSWLQAMRAGRFSGSLLRHPQFLWALLETDLKTGFAFAFRWPYALLSGS